MVCVVQQKTVIVFSTVAKKVITVLTVPHGLVPFLLEVVAVVAAMSPICPPYREMCSTETLHGWCG